MNPRERELEEILVSRLMRLNATVQGIVTGILFAFGIFVATNWLVLKGGRVVGPHLSLLGQYFIGYDVTFTGSLIGAVYGLAVGFAGGYLVATIYNRLADFREKRERRR